MGYFHPARLLPGSAKARSYAGRSYARHPGAKWRKTYLKVAVYSFFASDEDLTPRSKLVRLSLLHLPTNLYNYSTSLGVMILHPSTSPSFGTKAGVSTVDPPTGLPT